MVRGTDLKILGLVGSDAGVYQCLATSPAGSIQAAAQLIVKSKGKKVQSRGSQSKKSKAFRQQLSSGSSPR